MSKNRSRNRSAERPRGIKATNEQLDERIDVVISLICRGFRSSQIVRSINHQYGVNYRTVATYIARAQERMRERVNRSKSDLVTDSLLFYESITQNPDATITDKLKARTRIDELFGLDKPRRSELSGPGGAPIPVQNSTPLPSMTREELRETLTILKAQVAGEKKTLPPRAQSG